MIEPARSPISVAAARLGCTEGQLYTMVIGVIVALLLGVPGIPAALRDRPTAARVDDALSPFDDGADDSAVDTAGPATPAPASPTADTVPLVVPPFRVPPIGVSGRAEAPAAAASPTDAAPAAPGPAAPVPGSIVVFARVAAPGAPGGIAVASDGTVFVTTDNGTARGGRGASRVFSYDAAGTPIASHAIAGQRGDRAGGLTGAAAGPTPGRVTVLDPETARVVDVDMAAGTQAVLATVPDLPACLVSLGVGLCQPGIEDREPFLVSAAYDRQRNLFVADAAQGTIWRLPAGARAPEVWYQSTYFASGDGPFGLAVHDAAVEFTVGTTIDPAAFDTGALYRLAVDGDGSAGSLTLVHAFEAGDQPGALAVATSGSRYVVLRNGGAIVSLGRDGSQTGRIDPPGAGPIPLDAPSAVALVPGALLVANGRTSADPNRWTVLKVVLGR